MRRLLVVAENSLIVEAISIGLRQSGEFELLGRMDSRQASARSILDARPDVVVVDELEPRERMLDLVRSLRLADEQLTVIVLTLAHDPEWLDQIFAVGATSAVSKATPPAALATLVRETIDGHVLHLHKPLRAGAGSEARAGAPEGPLSSREMEVLQLVAAGSTNSEIARRLWVTEQTVKFHLSNIYRKLDVGNRTEASRYAHLNGLVGGDSPPGT